MHVTWRAAAPLVGALMLAAACTSSAGNAIRPSPSTQASPSTEASASSSPPAETPSSAPTQTPAGSPLAITSVGLHGAEVGVGYGSVALGARGGTPPYSWSVTAGSLPAGIRLSTAGVVSGTPSAAGHPTFTVTVRDSAAAIASSPSSINVVSRLAISTPCASLCSVESGCTVCGAFGSISGGAGPFRYTVTGGAVPAGMGLNGLTVTGPFPPPGPLGAYSLTVVVTDQLGVQQTAPANWNVFAHLALATTKATCTQSSAQCTIQIAYSGGTPGGTPTVSVGAFNPAAGPPNGHTVSVGGGNLNFQANGQGWSGTVTITLTDQSLCGPGSARCSASVFVTITL
jgi:hypothetical protein